MDCSVESSQGTPVVAIATILVAFQVLGLALYQAGALHLRSSNTLLIQALLNIAIGSILWYCVGYSLVYGPSQKGFIGSLDHAFFLDVTPSNCTSKTTTVYVPRVLFATFEMMLAITAPYMVISAWTENISMVGAAIVFTLWPILVYYPLSHWIRGGGWLNAMRVIDYSGSLTVHASLGASALVFTRILRPCVPEINSTRASFQRMNALSHMMLVGGAFISIMGWYAVNVASTIIQTGSSLASISVVNTHLSSSTSLLCWLVVSTLESRGLLYSDVIAGLIAGVIGSSAAAASMQVWASLLSGLLAGVTSSLALCCARRWGPYWTNGSPVDFIYINGVPGLFAALSGTHNDIENFNILIFCILTSFKRPLPPF